ncbi:unnamed protein product [Cyprideis torosa]|uniref:chitinase n=1 Tax=Cyprideis torosa TaxID=163714 RepID=A0A7R8ZHW5_9CRUS|nr:unnamed protein product [Cyprideis torosa]CAG0884715.1 unnamed protein product [Cyprideis torosa]
MTYDFHGHWDKITGHVSPLFYHPDDFEATFHTEAAIDYWLEKGAPKNKIVMGMPLYGQSFSLAKPDENGLNAKAPEKGQAGQYTRQAGFLAYYEICTKIQREGFQVNVDSDRRIGPYAFKGRQWISFDDVEMLQLKSEYIREKGLAGGMIWALDLDDFNNVCGQGKHPLLRTIAQVLAPPRG